MPDFKPDLSTGTYDELETRLSNFFETKIILVRDWKRPDTCGYSDGKYGSDDTETQKLTDQYTKWIIKRSQNERVSFPDPLETATAKSLKKYLQDRDPKIGNRVTQKEMYSLSQKGHIALRTSNAKPIDAIIVFDTIKTQEELIPNLVHSYTFNNMNVDIGKENWDIPHENFIENLDIDPDDYRIYEAVRRITYALNHQTEFEHSGNPREHRSYQRFDETPASRSNFADYGIDSSFTNLGFYDACDRVFITESTIHHNHEELGIKDKNISEKILLLDAASHVYFSSLAPVKTFATLYVDHKYNKGSTDHPFRNIGGHVHNMGDILDKRLNLEIKKRCPKNEPHIEHAASKDLRVLIPLFREIKDDLIPPKPETKPQGQADKDNLEYYNEDIAPLAEEFNNAVKRDPEIEEAYKIYLDTVWKGIERYFPTLAKAPVPELRKNAILPLTAADYKKQTAPNQNLNKLENNG